MAFYSRQSKKFFIDQAPVKLHIWDTPGQARHYPITRSYFPDADAILVAIDLNMRNYAEQAMEWMAKVKSEFTTIARSPQFILVGTQCDGLEAAAHQGALLHIALENGFSFFVTSAKGNYKVSDLFEDITKACIDKQNTIDPDSAKDYTEVAYQEDRKTVPHTLGSSHSWMTRSSKSSSIVDDEVLEIRSALSLK